MPAPSTSPATRAYKVLKKRIVNLAYAPGARLSEERLADELGLGRSPIRTALAQLSNDGWILISPKSGTYVRSLSDKEVADLLNLRLLLEAHVAKEAAGRISEAKLRELRESLDRLRPRRSRNSKAALFNAYNQFDGGFHAALYRAAGNALITDILLDLVDKIDWIKTSAPMSQQRIEQGLLELGRILEALEARDAKAAALRMHEHISNAARYASESRSQPSGDEVITDVRRRNDRSGKSNGK